MKDWSERVPKSGPFLDSLTVEEFTSYCAWLCKQSHAYKRWAATHTPATDEAIIKGLNDPRWPNIESLRAAMGSYPDRRPRVAAQYALFEWDNTGSWRHLCVHGVFVDGMKDFPFGSIEEPTPVDIPPAVADLFDITEGEMAFYVHENERNGISTIEWSRDPADWALPMTRWSMDDMLAYARWAGNKSAITFPHVQYFATWNGDLKKRTLYPWGDTWEGGRCNSAEAKHGKLMPVYTYGFQGLSWLGLAGMLGDAFSATGTEVVDGCPVIKANDGSLAYIDPWSEEVLDYTD